MKKLFSALLALTLALAPLPASALTLEDAKGLLEANYVDDIPDSVLELDSLDAILEAIGDPYTCYMTPEQYEDYIKGVNGDSVVGIGASVETAFDGGYRIMSVLPGSPALEAGLQPGDVLTAVDGVPFTAEVDPRVLIAGEEGTQLTITLTREGQTLEFTLKRREVDIPIVTYEMRDGAAYIDCVSFGGTTAATFREAIQELDEDTAAWIVDLRANPGGESNSTITTASCFTGGGVLLYFRDGTGSYHYGFTPPGLPDLTDKPVIILTSEHSASGSELFAGEIRSYNAGIALGQRTFGKGIAQIMLTSANCPCLEDGEALKITAYRFFVSDGATNHITGVLPTLLISPENTEKAAMLLTCPYSDFPENHLRIDLAGQTFVVNMGEALEAENRAAFTELLEALPLSARLLYSTGKNWDQCEPISPAGLAKELGLKEFTPRTFSDTADSPYAREIDTLAAYRLLSGDENGMFRPKDTISRAEFCAMVASALDLPARESGKFSDVSADAWYAGAVSAMADRGFISGYEDGSFRPEGKITFQETAAILNKVAGWTSMDGEDLNTQELTEHEKTQYAAFAGWAQLPARNLSRLNALAGDPTPTGLATREASAAMLCRLMENTHLIWN